MYYFAQKYYFIPYEIIKVGKIIVLAIILFGVSVTFEADSKLISFTLKTALLLIFPICLYYLKVFELIEIDRTKKIVLKRLKFLK